MSDAAPRLADTPIPWEPETELARLHVGSEVLRVTVQRTRRRARCVGKSSGWTATTTFWFQPSPGRWVPSRFGRAAPTCDARLLPLLARLLLDAAGAAEREGLLTAACWERAGLTPPGADA